MLLSLAAWLQTVSPDFGFFRVFQYITFRAVMAALTALLIGLAFGPWVIRRLAELKIGQPIREYGVKEHIAKSGTPHSYVSMKFDVDTGERDLPAECIMAPPRP